MRVGRGGVVGLAEDACRDFADHAGDQMAVALQAHIVQVARLVQIHLAAVDHGLQVRLRDAVLRGTGHQRLHHRVRGLACIGFGNFTLPPGELGRCHAGVGDFVHDIVDLAAKGVERRNGRAARLGQKKEGVIKAAA
ncbi:hypothetical protein D3C78_1424210 [compost metagenome]